MLEEVLWLYMQRCWLDGELNLMRALEGGDDEGIMMLILPCLPPFLVREAILSAGVQQAVF